MTKMIWDLDSGRDDVLSASWVRVTTRPSVSYHCASCVLFGPVCPPGRGDIQPQLDSAMQDVSDKYILLEETEKQALRKALIEDRQRICSFVEMLQPVVVSVQVGVEGLKVRDGG